MIHHELPTFTWIKSCYFSAVDLTDLGRETELLNKREMMLKLEEELLEKEEELTTKRENLLDYEREVRIKDKKYVDFQHRWNTMLYWLMWENERAELWTIHIT